MNYFNNASGLINTRAAVARRLCGALMLLAGAALSACGHGEEQAGQALASVNGEEITMLQLNLELQRAGGQSASQEGAGRQLLEALINRQLLQNEAARDRTDRDPSVVQAIERAKALIVAQAYLQKRIGAIARPTRQEVEAYFAQHPEAFTRRKQFELNELVVATRDLDDGLKAAIASSASLEEVALWLDNHKVRYARTQLSPTSADLAPELNAKLLAMPKGRLFIVQQGEHSLLGAIAEVRDTPVTLDMAAPMIEQFLVNQKSREAADAELARLRAGAKIKYLNPLAPAAPPAAAPPAAAPQPENASGTTPYRGGVAGLN